MIFLQYQKKVIVKFEIDLSLIFCAINIKNLDQRVPTQKSQGPPKNIYIVIYNFYSNFFCQRATTETLLAKFIRMLFVIAKYTKNSFLEAL